MSNTLKLEVRLLKKGIIIYIIIFLFASMGIGSVYLNYKNALKAENDVNKYRMELAGQLDENISPEDRKQTFEPLDKLIYAAYEGINTKTAPENTMLVFAGIATMFAAILSSNLFGSEYVKKTIKVRAAHYGLLKTVLAKIIVMFAIACFIPIFGFLIGKVVSYPIWNSALKLSEFASKMDLEKFNPNFIPEVLLIILGFMTYGLLSAFAAMVTKNNLAGAVIGIFIPYFEKFTSWWFLPFSAYSNLLSRVFHHYAGGMFTITPNEVGNQPLWTNWAILLGWCLVFTMGILVYSKKQEN